MEDNVDLIVVHRALKYIIHRVISVTIIITPDSPVVLLVISFVPLLIHLLSLPCISPCWLCYRAYVYSIGL